ncbi:MAG: serine hydrolase [Actinomycetota bacterium]
MRTTGTPLAAALVALAMVVAACSDSDDADPVAADTAAPPTTAAPADTAEPAPETTLAAAPETTAVATLDPQATLIAVDEPALAGIAPVIEEAIATNGLNGAGLIVVDADDGVVHHQHWGELSEDRISLIASSSKMITAGVLLHLADDGLLDMDAPVAEVTEWGAGQPDITPAQLLSNSSGLPGLISGPSLEEYLCMFDSASTLQTCAETIFTTPVDGIGSPDTAFDYGGAQWQVAGAVAEAASGQSWADLIEEIFVDPCGLDTLAFGNHFGQFPGFSYPDGFDGDPSILAATENPNMEGGAYVSTGDYGELLLMLLRDGRCGDTQVLSSESITLMTSDRIAEVYGGDAGEPTSGYGMGWWVDRDDGYVVDPGAYGSVAWLDLEDGYGAYLVIEDSGDVGQPLAEALRPIVDTAMAARG